MFEKVCQSEKLREAAGLCDAGRVVRLCGVWGSSSAMIAAALGRLRDAPVLLIVNHPDDDAAADDIEIFLKGDSKNAHPGVYQFPAWEAQLADDHVSGEVTGERIGLLNLLSGSAAGGQEVQYIVAPILALLQPVPTPMALAQGRLGLRRGMEQDPQQLLEWLVDGGFESVEQVDRQGEFAHRGGIIDIFPPAGRSAVRVEYFGERIESIRTFDLDTQRSIAELEACDLTALSAGRGEAGEKATTLLEYLPAETIICMVEPKELRAFGEQLYGRIRDDLAANADNASPVALCEVEKLFAAMERFRRVEMHLFSAAGGAIRLGIRSLERLAINTAEALEELEALSESAEVWIYCENAAEKDHFQKTLAERYPKLHRRVHLAEGHVAGGFYWPGLKLAVVGHSEIYHRYSKVRRIRRVRAGRPIESMLDLHEGDYVVHVAHGIAKFAGLRRLQRDGAGEEYLRLRFADNAVLHVPTGQINLVQKYIGAKGSRPSLSRLGGAHWARTKQRVSEAVKDLAAELLRIQAARQSTAGISYPADTQMQRQLAAEFIYTETEDQISSIRQIDADLTRPRPMDRLLCGDVGYGKTELAMRAAFKVIEAGRQVAVLVPTTVLADQHYRTFSERFADYPVTVDVISRFRTPAQQERILRRLSEGRIDVLIGTHRLLSGDVHFADLGLLVIDEEQRFGVTHKEHLKVMRATLDVLTLTATPIPRTLHMALLGLRDISSLATPPMDRRAIHTEVCDYDESLIRTAILRELNRGGQVFFVHNRVRDIEAVAGRIRALADDARVATGHGQMPQRALEQVMLKFVRGEIDVLVCTTIIESGLDIPTANTMIIHEADRFGLSELHQLRGRVGRYKHRAYCYLLLPERRTVAPPAAKRLKAIEDFCDLGAGFQIAMRDLEIRGAGNILGPQQSGHIAAVGYELYCRLLEQSVAQLRGKPVAVHIDVHIELGIEACIPRSYIPLDRQRMEIYRRLAHFHDPADLKQVRLDLVDAFGPIPPRLDVLLDLAEVRILAADVGIKSIVLKGPDIVFRVLDHHRSEPLFAGATGSVRLPDEQTIHWRPPENYLQMPTLLRVLLKRLREAETNSK